MSLLTLTAVLLTLRSFMPQDKKGVSESEPGISRRSLAGESDTQSSNPKVLLMTQAEFDPGAQDLLSAAPAANGVLRKGATGSR